MRCRFSRGDDDVQRCEWFGFMEQFSISLLFLSAPRAYCQHEPNKTFEILNIPKSTYHIKNTLHHQGIACCGTESMVRSLRVLHEYVECMSEI
jgi:hypothetical protein